MQNKKLFILLGGVFVMLILCCLASGLILIVQRNASRNEYTNPIDPDYDLRGFDRQDTTNETCTAEDAGVSEEDFELLLLTYKDPFVVHVRTSLDNYLAGSNEGISPVVIDGMALGESADKYGLNTFSKEYYKSDFLIYWVDNQSIAGGKNFTVFFKDMPDKMFTFWVYDLAGGGYELRGMWDAGYSEEEMQEVVEQVGCLMDDDRFAL